MPSEYKIQRHGETLTARLVEKDQNTVEIMWENQEGSRHYSRIKDGDEIRRWGFDRFRGHWEEVDFVTGYHKAYTRLGPELREQLPEEWKTILGSWLMATEKELPSI